MKKIYKAVSVLAAFALTAIAAGCKTTQTETKEDPYKFEFSLNEDKESYTLTGYSVSAEAKTLADSNDYEALAALFSGAGGEFDENTVRTLTIPETYENLPVTKIAANAVVNLAYIDEVVVKSNITEIGAGAFSGLSSLKKITLPFVGKKAGGLDYVKADKSFGYIFGTASGTGLTSCTQKYNDADGETAYYIPETLKEVTVTGENSYVGTEEIKYDEKDGEMIKSEDGSVTKTFDVYDLAVQPYAFYGCTTIETVNFTAEKFETVFESTFSGCTSLKSFVAPNSLKEIRECAFEGCSSLRSADLKSTETIGERAFEGCSVLGERSFALSDGEYSLTLTAKTIGKYAFKDCVKLEKVNLTNTPTVKEYAFEGCKKVEIVGAVDAASDEKWVKDTSRETTEE